MYRYHLLVRSRWQVLPVDLQQAAYGFESPCNVHCHEFIVKTICCGIDVCCRLSIYTDEFAGFAFAVLSIEFPKACWQCYDLLKMPTIQNFEACLVISARVCEDAQIQCICRIPTKYASYTEYIAVSSTLCLHTLNYSCVQECPNG